MTRTEVIKKLVSHAEVNDSDSKLFTEIFLQKASELLNVGDKIFFDEIGEFKLKKNYLRNSYTLGRQSSILSFCEERFFGQSNELIFEIPLEKIHDVSPLDFHFSLSIGKPLIPKKIINLDEIYPIYSPADLKNFLEQKVDNLFSKGKIEKGRVTIAESGAFVPISEDESQLVKKDVEDIFEDNKLNAESSKEKENISWEFGDDWQTELEEDSILNLTSEKEFETNFKIPVQETIDEDSFEWDFGNSSKTKVDVVERSIEENKLTISDDEVFEIDWEAEKKKYEDFSPVVTKTSELQIDFSDFEEEEEENFIFNDIESDSEKREDEDNSKADDFVEVHSTSEKVLFPSDYDEYLKNRTKEFSEEENDRDKELIKSTFQDESNLNSEEKIVPSSEPQVKNEKKNISMWYLVSALIILSVTGFLYYKMFGIPTWLQSKEIVSVQILKTKPIIIERDYSIPVNYPYELMEEKSNKNEVSNEKIIQSSVKPIENQLNEENKPEIKMNTNNLDEKELFSKKNPLNQSIKKEPELKPEKKIQTIKQEKIPLEKKIETKPKHNLVSGEDSKFSVQVSSWKQKEIAEQEVNRFKSRGLNAYLSSVYIPEKGGTWYRVKVGGFNSKQEADNFLKSFQK